MSALTVENVSKTYERSTAGQLDALDAISFEVREKAFVGVVGPSGCGKTTLLRIIAGLEDSNRGEIRVSGNRVAGPGRDRAVVFQAPSLFPWYRVLRNVGYGLECMGVPRKEWRRIARDRLTLVGLADFEEQYPYELSGGMQQRVNLARALAVDPSILLLDEPFAALDPQMRELMQEELLGIWTETGKTVLLITHQIEEAVFLSDRVLVMSARPGRVLEEIDVALPRPRRRHSQEFQEYVDHIWRVLESEIRATAALETATVAAERAPAAEGP